MSLPVTSATTPRHAARGSAPMSLTTPTTPAPAGDTAPLSTQMAWLDDILGRVDAQQRFGVLPGREDHKAAVVVGSRIIALLLADRWRHVAGLIASHAISQWDDVARLIGTTATEAQSGWTAWLRHQREAATLASDHSRLAHITALSTLAHDIPPAPRDPALQRQYRRPATTAPKASAS